MPFNNISLKEKHTELNPKLLPFNRNNCHNQSVRIIGALQNKWKPKVLNGNNYILKYRHIFSQQNLEMVLVIRFTSLGSSEWLRTLVFIQVLLRYRSVLDGKRLQCLQPSSCMFPDPRESPSSTFLVRRAVV